MHFSIAYLLVPATNEWKISLVVFKVCLHESNESCSPHSHVAGLLHLLALHSEFSLPQADHVACLIPDLGRIFVLARATPIQSISACLTCQSHTWERTR